VRASPSKEAAAFLAELGLPSDTVRSMPPVGFMPRTRDDARAFSLS